jgi:O-antigen/teichoic acid export membrane protein
MKILLRSLPLVFMFAGVFLLFQRPAYAYTDPGTGLLAIQAVGSALVATGWYLRRKIYSLLHWGSSSKVGQEPPSLESEDSSQQ